MAIQIIREKISKTDLAKIASEGFGDMVKAVVDIKKEIMAISGEMHSDEEAVLLQDGSCQEDLWGINIYPLQPEENWIEFDSVINLRPRQNNRSRGVEDSAIQEKIKSIVKKLVV